MRLFISEFPSMSHPLARLARQTQTFGSATCGAKNSHGFAILSAPMPERPDGFAWAGRPGKAVPCPVSVAKTLTTVHWDPLLIGMAPTLLEMIRIRFARLTTTGGNDKAHACRPLVSPCYVYAWHTSCPFLPFPFAGQDLAASAEALWQSPPHHRV